MAIRDSRVNAPDDGPRRRAMHVSVDNSVIVSANGRLGQTGQAAIAGL